MEDLFKNISQKNQEKILKILESTTLFYKKNSIITLQEKMIGLVIEGAIDIIKNDYAGNTTLIDECHENDVFDSITIPIVNEDYEILVKTDSRITLISFDEVLQNDDINDGVYNQFLKNLLSVMSSRMNKRNERIAILVNKTIRDKLLAYFRLLSKKRNSRNITLPFTYTELASYLSIDRSAMNRELKNLKEDGLIETSGRHIKLKFYM